MLQKEGNRVFVPETTREKLFVAAVEVFADKGFKGATVRDICKKAGSANMNAVNYHFGGKAKLYKLILERMFAELGRLMRDLGSMDGARDPEERLCDLVRAYCAMLFANGEFSMMFLAIYNKEIVQPSPYLKDLVDRHVTPQNRDILALMRELFEPDAPLWLVRDCGVSVFSQVIYYSSTWVLFKQVNPDHPGMEAYHEHLAEHVCRFSLAGIREMRRAYAAGELSAPEEKKQS